MNTHTHMLSSLTCGRALCPSSDSFTTTWATLHAQNREIGSREGGERERRKEDAVTDDNNKHFSKITHSKHTPRPGTPFSVPLSVLVLDLLLDSSPLTVPGSDVTSSDKLCPRFQQESAITSGSDQTRLDRKPRQPPG